VSPVNSRQRILDVINGATDELLVESLQFADADVRAAVVDVLLFPQSGSRREDHAQAGGCLQAGVSVHTAAACSGDGTFAGSTPDAATRTHS